MKISLAESRVSRATSNRPPISYGDPAFLLQREPDGSDMVVEVSPWRRHLAQSHRCASLEQVVDHPHRVAALFLGLAVEEASELRKGLRLVVGTDRHVLMSSRELTADLLVQGLDESL